MYVCMYVFIYVRMYVWVCACMYVYVVNVCIDVCICVYMRVCMYVCMYALVYKCLYMRECVHTLNGSFKEGLASFTRGHPVMVTGSYISAHQTYPFRYIRYADFTLEMRSCLGEKQRPIGRVVDVDVGKTVFEFSVCVTGTIGTRGGRVPVSVAERCVDAILFLECRAVQHPRRVDTRLLGFHFYVTEIAG